MRLELVQPFHDVYDYVMANPQGKRFPKGFHGRFRRVAQGGTNLERFCAAWMSLCEDFPGLITQEDVERFAPAFQLYMDN